MNSNRNFNIQQYSELSPRLIYETRFGIFFINAENALNLTNFGPPAAF